MTETSREFSQATSTTTPNAISSPVLAAGRQRSLWPDGPSEDQSGQDHVPANRSRSLGKGKAKTTSDTCGPSSSGSSASVDLQSSLASKLADLTDLDGSMEYSLTWKESITPAGRRISRLQALARRTGDTGFSGRPTPDTTCSRGADKGEGWKRPSGHNRASTLNRAAWLSGWNTPRATDGSKGGPNQAGGALPADAALSAWATPAARDWKNGQASDDTMNRNSRPLNEQVVMLVRGPILLSSSDGTASVAESTLNPAMSRWLMGYHRTWDVASPAWGSWLSVQDVIVSAA